MTYSMMCTLSYGPKMFDIIYNFTKIIFDDERMNVYWMGDLYESIQYKDIIRIETKKNFLIHWYKIMWHNSAIYIQPSSEKKFKKFIEDNNIELQFVKKLT